VERRGVVIIGAGPAGSSAAKAIAEAGHDTLLLEKDRFPGETAVCGGVIAGEFAESALRKLPVGIVDKHLTSWLIHLPGKTYYVSNLSTISFRRSVFDRFLAEDAARSGADLRVRTLATDIRRDSKGLTIRVKDLDTFQEYSVETPLVIFADGPNTLAKTFGLGFPRARPDITASAAIYDLEWKENPLNCFECFFDERISPWGYGWIFPKKDIVNVGVGCLISRMKGNITRYLDYFVQHHIGVSPGLQTLRRLRFAADLIPLAPARRIIEDNMIVIGDAAGMVDPLWGGGIAWAMMAGSMAGEVAVLAMKENAFSSRVLYRFGEMWKATPQHRYMQRASIAHALFLKYSRLDKQAFFKLMRLALWRGKTPELKLASEDLLARVISLSNLS